MTPAELEAVARARAIDAIAIATRYPADFLHMAWAPGIVPALRWAALREGGSVLKWEVRSHTEWTIRGSADRWTVVVYRGKA